MECPFCRSQDVRRLADAVGAVDWCQECGRTWVVEPPPGKAGAGALRTKPRANTDTAPTLTP